MNFKVTGIEKQAQKNLLTFGKINPTGAVRFVRDEGNKYDPYCIEVWWKDIMLGYVPAYKENGVYVGSELQKRLIEGGIEMATISKVGWYDGQSWNNDGDGWVQSVEISLDIPEHDSGRIAGADYMRVTQFIGYFSPYGGNSDGLIRWAYDQAPTFDGYKDALTKTSEAGTEMHTAIEQYLRGECGLDNPNLPEGWVNFINKYDIEPIMMEERFYDNELMVTGQPDFFGWVNGVLSIIDWKSSKKPSLKHKIQGSIYAKNCYCDGVTAEQALVVAFGANTKQRFSVGSVNREQIENNYEAMRLLRRMIDLTGVPTHNFNK